MRRTSWWGIFFLILVFTLSACTGEAGQAGPAGPPGAQGIPGPAGRDGDIGPAGPAGVDGLSYAPPSFIGAEACAECHQDTYDRYRYSGHAWQLTQVVDGQSPDYPWSSVSNPPSGYTWDDISYIVGGYEWKALFLDRDGYIITGDAAQYNLANRRLGQRDEWVAFHADENQPYDCGACHTTGYSAVGHQDGLEGIVGTWAEPGISCEECHGPGSLHAANPLTVRLAVGSSAAVCSDCHVRNAGTTLMASDGFIQHHDEYIDLFPGKHAVIDCVTCHDPHDGVNQLRETNEATTRATCENCHYQQAQVQTVGRHMRLGVDCVDCHMPRLIVTAEGDAAFFSGDVRTHLTAIDPNLIGQFTEEGEVIPQLGLEFACRSCHVDGGNAPAWTDEELKAVANGYHMLSPVTPESEAAAQTEVTTQP